MNCKELLSRASIIAFCLTLSTKALATQPLEQFLERSKQHSFDARESQATTRQRDAEADAQLGRLLPVFTARGVYTHNQYEASAQLPGMTERLVIIPKNQLDAFLQLDVPIIDLSSYHRYKSTRALARVAEEQQAVTQIEVSRAVTRAYYQFIGASALVRSANQSLAAADANLKNVDVRRAAGAATDLDYERALANVERSRQDVADAELAVQLSARALETLSGLTPMPAEDLPPDELRSEGPLDRWLSMAGETPSERAARHAMEATAQARKAANTALLPTLTGIAQERFTNATGFAGREAFYTLQLVLSWRLDYGVIASTKAQSAAVDVQTIRQERIKRSVLDGVFEAHRRVDAGIFKSRAARAQARAATRAAELAAERYGAGVATQLDVTQAQREAFLASAARIQADADLAYARAALRLAVGRSASDRRAP